jgi:hypothetical protein
MALAHRQSRRRRRPGCTRSSAPARQPGWEEPFLPGSQRCQQQPDAPQPRFSVHPVFDAISAPEGEENRTLPADRLLDSWTAPPYHRSTSATLGYRILAGIGAVATAAGVVLSALLAREGTELGFPSDLIAAVLKYLVAVFAFWKRPLSLAARRLLLLGAIYAGHIAAERLLSLYFFVGEGLTNVLKHAAAQQAVVRLWSDGASLLLASAEALVLSESAVEKHSNAIFGRLGLAEEPQLHRRKAAVLAYLRRVE